MNKMGNRKYREIVRGRCEFYIDCRGYESSDPLCEIQKEDTCMIRRLTLVEIIEEGQLGELKQKSEN